ncbi:hypothetical protein KCH_11080 [Kitasatospora cheerisanensis KCTC 2395]|uniref:Uncharacterized protein n=1 Tax=Kitasatospora cheerisanensis KCTC 2395 TaxID=1348663 RepID=A0A066YZP8_9ACTN|nr:hypothetical protein KCH_11080 [Kitasatospora cheerisanensis KCTC 2395]
MEVADREQASVRHRSPQVPPPPARHFRPPLERFRPPAHPGSGTRVDTLPPGAAAAPADVLSVAPSTSVGTPGVRWTHLCLFALHTF